jgi:hypothetical protein
MNNFLQPFSRLISSLTKIIGGGIGGLLLAVGTIVFFASVIAFIAARAKGDGKGLEDAKNRLLLSAVGLFFMVGVWGIVLFLELNILGGSTRSVCPPQTIFTPGATGGCNSSTGSGGTYYGNSGVSAQSVNCSAGEYCAYDNNDIYYGNSFDPNKTITPTQPTENTCVTQTCKDLSF